MANYTAADVKKLRETTGAGMLDCKNALQDADGDMTRAVQILRVKGAKGVGKREGRTASNGLLAAKLDPGAGVLIELNCETDFVAKTEPFTALGDTIAAVVAEQKPADLPALATCVSGGKTVQQLLDEANASLGEKVEVRRFVRYGADNATDGTAGYVSTYLHRTSPDLPPTVGVLIELDKENEPVAHEVAQHIAAMMPRVVAREDIDDQTLADERRIAEETAKAEGKPEQALPKIIEGRVNGFIKDVALLEQGFVKEPKKPVGVVLRDAGVVVRRFVRYRVGQA